MTESVLLFRVFTGGATRRGFSVNVVSSLDGSTDSVDPPPNRKTPPPIRRTRAPTTKGNLFDPFDSDSLDELISVLDVEAELTAPPLCLLCCSNACRAASCIIGPDASH